MQQLTCFHNLKKVHTRRYTKKVFHNVHSLQSYYQRGASSKPQEMSTGLLIWAELWTGHRFTPRTDLEDVTEPSCRLRRNKPIHAVSLPWWVITVSHFYLNSLSLFCLLLIPGSNVASWKIPDYLAGVLRQIDRVGIVRVRAQIVEFVL